MKKILLIISMFIPQKLYAENEFLDVLCERESLSIEIDRAEKSINIITNMFLDDILSKYSDLRIEGIESRVRKGGHYIGQEELYSYYLNQQVFPKSVYKVIYPNGKELDIRYTLLSMTEENLESLRKKKHKNIESSLSKMVEPTQENPCPIELRYYIEYN